MKKIFIGIDFSKLKFDAAILNGETSQIIDCKEFKNEGTGYNEMLKWIQNHTKMPSKDWLFCGEHTGLYCVEFSKFTNIKGYDFWLEPGLRIKQSQGMTRGKNDKIDAIRIANYAYRHKDQAVCYKSRDLILEQIKDLMAYRNRLIEAKKAIEVSSKELIRVKTNDKIAQYISDDSNILINTYKNKIKDAEDLIMELVRKEEELKENYDLLTSIKGIGMINSILVLVFTNNFTLFSDARKFGCYCGVVPFSHSSGTSVGKRDKISQLANKSIKASLTQAARTAVMYDAVLKAYYERKLKEGKNKKLVINNVRNKLIHIMFATIKSRQKYEANYIHPLQQAA
jgi:transposase